MIRVLRAERIARRHAGRLEVLRINSLESPVIWFESDVDRRVKRCWLGVSVGVLIWLYSSLAASANESDHTAEELADLIVANGTNETAEERHTVELVGCVMTTYRWKYFEGEGFILYTSIRFNMQAASMSPIGPAGEPFLVLDGKKGKSSFQVFRMKAPEQARFERPARRKRQPDAIPSPRQAQEPYFYNMTDWFAITHDGLASNTKPANFARYFEEYKRRYCSFLG